MRLETSLFAGRESLISHGTALNTIGDDLANSNTPGYKATRVDFADIFAGGTSNLFGGPIQTGSGSQVSSVSINHRLQGTMEQTGRSLDAGIVGNGWFVLQDGDQRSYTRAGNFTTDPEGNIVSADGLKVLGYTSSSPDTPVPLNVENLVGTSTATTSVSINGSLDPVSPLVEAIPAGVTFKELNATASYTNTFKAIDSLGNKRDVSLYFYRTANLTWDVRAYVDGAQAGGVAGTPVAVGAGRITVGPDGKQPEGTVNTMALTPAWGDGAAAGNIALDLSKFSSTAGASSLTNISTDGFRGGVVSSVGFSNEGKLTAVLETGEELNIAELAIADFNSPDNLERVGNNNFKETTESGVATIAKAGTGGMGAVKGTSLETSNVDPANVFVKMIQIQQGYRASSQVIQAVNDLVKATIQIA